MQVLTDLDGRRIGLTDERWQHIREHPEMAGMEAVISETVAAPAQVYNR